MRLKPTFATRMLFFLFSDLFLSFFTLYAAYALRFNFAIPGYILAHFWYVALPLAGLKIGAFAIFRIYHKSWRFFGLRDLKQLIYAHIVAYGVFAALFVAFSDWFNPAPRSAVIIDFFLSILVLGGLRISKRLLLESSGDKSLTKALVVGVTPRTAQIIKSALAGEIPYYPVAVIDPEGKLGGTYIENVKVYPPDALESTVKKEGATAAMIADKFSARELDRLVERLNGLGIEEIKTVSLLSDRSTRLKDIAIEDLLAREPKDLDTDAIRAFIGGKTVLVTGAGGSIGSEICRQVLGYGARKLIMVDNAEYNLYQITDALASGRAVPKLLSVLERERLEALFAEHRPDIVIHAAAYKHVPLCEINDEEAIRNNVLGVKNVIDLSIAHGVQKVVNISSDKAVRPTNVMGATKRIGELYAQNAPSGDTEIVSVRFGNVLGSSGSVVPKFKAQIEAGGPVTVTHPEITRYFMLIPEACQLVLQAAAIAKGGELFILDMGEPVRIADLAKKMIRLYGKEGEIGIVYTGLRPGEKLYEELLIDEAEYKTEYEEIYVAGATPYDFDRLNRDIEELLRTEKKRDVLRKIVPEYSRREADRLHVERPAK